MPIPTSDVIRDLEIAEEAARVEQQIYGGFEYISRPDIDQRTQEIFDDLRGGVMTTEVEASMRQSLPGDQAKAAGYTVARTARSVTEAVQNALPALGSALRSVGLWGVVVLGLVAVISVARASRAI